MLKQPAQFTIFLVMNKLTTLFFAVLAKHKLDQNSKTRMCFGVAWLAVENIENVFAIKSTSFGIYQTSLKSYGESA